MDAATTRSNAAKNIGRAPRGTTEGSRAAAVPLVETPVVPAGDPDPEVQALVATEPILLRILRQRALAVLRRRRQVRAVATADSIHDLRVATRRLQELLDLFEPVLPGGESRKVRRRARRIRRDLAQVRDADILSDLVADLAGQATAEERPALLALERRLTLEAGRLRGALAQAGRDGLPVPGINKRLRRLLESLQPVSLHRLGVAGREGLRKRDHELRSAMWRARTGRSGDLHALRLAVKRWRYSLEVLQASGLRRCPKAITAARRLQTALGGIHDLDVLVQMVGQDAEARPLLAGLRRTRRRRVHDLQTVLMTFRARALRPRSGR